MSGKGYLNQRQ